MKHTIKTIAVVGLGYVGLPLAVHLSRKYPVVGIDIDAPKIEELKKNYDRMHEVSEQELAEANITYFTEPDAVAKADVIIIPLPTPIDRNNNPDLTLLKKGTMGIAKHMKKGAIVVYESTVYPGVTEDVCVPLLEKHSGLKYNEDFFVGYSPERINPGDKNRTIDKIIKVVSGSTPETAKALAEMYGSIVTAGVHVAPSIRVAEAAKVIENVQRDLNIALVNELAILFDKLGIDVHDVLEASGTKWNFHKYTPGLVGGHCIGVDPYYLTYKAEEIGYHPEIILAGRRINDNMHNFFAQKVIKELNKQGVATGSAKIAVLGLTFKENCPDFRNSRAKQLIHTLKDYGADVYGIDPWLDASVIKKFGAKPATLEDLETEGFSAAIVTVLHKEFSQLELSHVPVVLSIKQSAKKG